MKKLVIRANKKENFTVMNNFHLQDKQLSLKAKGLLSLILSLSDEWDYTISGLVCICKESKDAVNSAIKELKNRGYLKIEKTHKNGRFEYVYTIYEIPYINQEPQNPSIEINS